MYYRIRMAKKENLKVNYSKIARQYNCEASTVKRYYEGTERKVKKKKELNR